MQETQQYEIWKQNTKDNKAVYDELVSIANDEKAIEDRFFQELSFGTAGLRGKLGAGTNRMNEYTVGRTTFGVAEYIVNHYKNRSIVIAYDSRNMSTEFARLSAEIMSSKGVTAYLFDTLMPTPVLSYSVRKFKASMGIVITASHNPKEYNGYKVYNEKGCQITDSVADEITANINSFGYFNAYTPDEKLIKIIGEEVLDEFIETILQYSLPCNKKYYPSVVYTPLNGTGNVPVQKLFKKIGVENYVIVPEQKMPDGNFTTCPFPNPEEKAALQKALELAGKENATLVIATDPDADRVGIAERQEDGTYRLFTGNETGVLLLNFILSNKAKYGKLTGKDYAVKTIVTTPLAESIAKKYGVGIKNVLTGFKYIGETIDNCVNENYLFGMEESYGYLVGTHARDKDAVSAVMSIMQMASFYAENNQTLTKALESLYEEHGYYSTAVYSKYFEGKSGMEYMSAFMNGLRNTPWQNVGGEKVEKVTDYMQGINGLPKSNVLTFEGETFTLIIRPSGTEPKLKFYFTSKDKDKAKADENCAKLYSFVKEKLGD